MTSQEIAEAGEAERLHQRMSRFDLCDRAGVTQTGLWKLLTGNQKSGGYFNTLALLCEAVGLEIVIRKKEADTDGMGKDR